MEKEAKKTVAPRKRTAAKSETAAPRTPTAKKIAVKPAGEYVYALGRRKTAKCQTRLVTAGKGEVTANGDTLKDYFKTEIYVERVLSPLKAVGLDDKMDVHLKLEGGGLNGQADAARLGITRALMKVNEEYRKTFKKLGYVTRDPREKERKKYGKKKARKGSQWAKR